MSILGSARDVRFVWRLKVGSRAINANCAITIRIAHLLPVIVASDHSATVAAGSIVYGTLGRPCRLQRSVHHRIHSSLRDRILAEPTTWKWLHARRKQETGRSS